MKKLAFIMLALTIMGGIFTSCKKDKENNEPVAKEYTVVYKLESYSTVINAQMGYDTIYLSPCFSYDFTYTGADGKAVEVKDAKAGWKMEIKVNAPFTAKIEGNIKYNESELPTEYIIFSNTLANILYSGYYESEMGFLHFKTKEKFLKFVNEHPEKLNFSKTAEIK